jgi:two-component system CheB/CheR fusion protein
MKQRPGKPPKRGPKKSLLRAASKAALLAAGTGGSTAPRNASQIGKTIPIVGIGASAGGLEAFTQLLRALPPDTGMAFVFVQHLEARHESMLTKLLAKSTEMPIAEVEQGMLVQPNHVYVIPPNADIDVMNGALNLVVRKDRAGRHMPIDSFFQSLAEHRGARAIGVILSGTASDGTLGLKAIKAQGGITFAQEPESAKYDGMPRSAIAAGCIDFVLPPEGVARHFRRSVGIPTSGCRSKKFFFRHRSRSLNECSSCCEPLREWISGTTRNPPSNGASPAAWHCRRSNH